MTTIWMRQLSCHCEKCLKAEWKSCENEDAKVHKTASSASAPTLRSARTTLDGKRRLLARGGKLNKSLPLRAPTMRRAFCGGCAK